MKLFLTSSCISENLREPFLKFLEKDPRNIMCYFIPTAIDVEEEAMKWTVKSMDDLASVGLNVIWYALRFKTKEQVASELADADLIWVNGGNTFHLLEVARSTGFLEVVDSLVREDGVMYGGVSAGTIIANPTIESASWEDHGADENLTNMTDLTGLGFIDAFTHVHYNPEFEREIVKKKTQGKILYAIPDGAAVEVNGAEVILHGDIEVFE